MGRFSFTGQGRRLGGYYQIILVASPSALVKERNRSSILGLTGPFQTLTTSAGERKLFGSVSSAAQLAELKSKSGGCLQRKWI
jgi:hypothetical protein